jgi:hypothetical protein
MSIFIDDPERIYDFLIKGHRNLIRNETERHAHHAWAIFKRYGNYRVEIHACSISHSLQSIYFRIVDVSKSNKQCYRISGMVSSDRFNDDTEAVVAINNIEFVGTSYKGLRQLEAWWQQYEIRATLSYFEDVTHG